MEGWKSKLKDICDQMVQESKTRVELPSDSGLVSKVTDKPCEKGHTEKVFRGEEFECGFLYERAQGLYCGDCSEIFKSEEGINFAVYREKRFLPIMKRKLIENPSFLKEVTPDVPCYICTGPTYSIIKDLGFIDFYDNKWSVCINPECTWPGEHSESYRSER